MPLTPFQKEILAIIATNRSVESHVAGGLVLNAAPDSARLSKDVDLFHDAWEALDVASTRDCAALTTAGLTVEKRLWEKTFRSARIQRHTERTTIDWAQDAAWRFFPIEPDPILHWRLHPFDALTNKALAMGSRSETRDLLDLVSYSDRFPLHAVVWAACAKDAGFSPGLLLEMMRRFARIDPDSLQEMQSRVSATDLKRQWLTLAEQTETAITAAATAGIEIGLVFLAPDASVVWHDTPGAQPHRATLGGVLPSFEGFTPMPAAS